MSGALYDPYGVNPPLPPGEPPAARGAVAGVRSRLARPPATGRSVLEEIRHPHPPKDRGTFIFAPKGIGHGDPAGTPNPGALAGQSFTYATQYIVTVNPVMEHPRIDQTSLRQPISVAGWRRWVRTHMGVPFLQAKEGSVIHVPPQPRRRQDRAAMAPVFSRGFTYVLPYQSTAPGSGRVQNVGTGRGAGGTS